MRTKVVAAMMLLFFALEMRAQSCGNVISDSVNQHLNRMFDGCTLEYILERRPFTAVYAHDSIHANIMHLFVERRRRFIFFRLSPTLEWADLLRTGGTWKLLESSGNGVCTVLRARDVYEALMNDYFLR